MSEHGEWILIDDELHRITRRDHQARRFPRRMNLWCWTGPRQHDYAIDGAKADGGTRIIRKPIGGG